MRHRQKMKVFNRIFVKYGDFLKAALWKLTGDNELFAEAMQNSLLIIWQNIEKFDGRDCGNYLYRLVQKGASKAWSNRIRDNGKITAEQIDNSIGPEETASDNETINIVRQRIAELPPKQGRAIIMRYLEVKDYQGIASELQCSAETARSNVSKALTRLKQELAND